MAALTLQTTARPLPAGGPPRLERGATWAGLAMAGLVALAPLELREGLHLGPLSLTTSEMLAGLAAAVATLALVWTSQGARGGASPWPAWHHPRLARWTWGALALWGLLQLASASWADGDRGHIAKVGLRICGQMVLAGLALRWSAVPQFRQRLWTGLLAGLAIVTVLGLGERLLGREFEFVLQQFRDEPTWMLGEQRLSTVFYHANTCAAYLELTAPLLIVTALRCRARRMRWLLGLWAAVVAVLLSLTYSRAGLIAATVAAIALAWGGRKLPGRRRWIAVSLGWGLLVLAAYGANPDMRARIGLTERSYRPVYTFLAPCAGHPHDRLTVPLRIRNRGTWDLANRQAPAHFIHTWLTPRGKRVGSDWERLALPDLPAGVTVTVDVPIQLPAKPGVYLLAGDILRDKVLRVSGVGADLAWLGCRVVPEGQPLPEGQAAIQRPESDEAVRSVRGMDLERRHYWRAALLLWARKPWLGWGSDRFALVHREYVPGPGYDPRARAHSLLLETGVDLGWLGVAALIAWLSCAVIACRLAFLRNVTSDRDLAVAIAAGLCGIAVHNSVDYFLAYTQFALVFWPLYGTLVGIACSAPPTQTAAAPSPCGVAGSPPQEHAP